MVYHVTCHQPLSKCHIRDFNLAPAFRAGALFQDETVAASAMVITDLTAFAVRRGLRCFAFLSRFGRSIDHSDAVEVLSDVLDRAGGIS